MRISDLLQGTGAKLASGDPSTTLTDLSDDSRRVVRGGAFIVRCGTRCDGRTFIEEAVQRGASAVISESDPGTHDVAWVAAPRVDQSFTGRLAERFFAYPSRKLNLVGVTGTNGKTTTSFLVRHLLASSGYRCGMLTTVWNDDGIAHRPATLTTPGPIELSRRLAAMVNHGCRAAVIEVSSHALDQGRVASLAFDVGVFTNLTGDHLDYHDTMDRYAAAKARLFSSLCEDGWAVINADDPYADRMVRDAAASVVRCRVDGGPCGDGQCGAAVLELGTRHTDARLTGPWGTLTVRLPLVGAHNVANALHAVAAASKVANISQTLQRDLETAPAVPGRLEPVRGDGTAPAPTVLVDYAHTDDALRNAISAAKPLTRGRLVVVFGCGGDRDATKRPKMAATACRLADRIIITTDNARSEDPMAIIRDVRGGVPQGAATRVSDEPDRHTAIFSAINEAGPDDIVLIAGKGHEDYQIIGNRKHHFDDREVAAEALAVRDAAARAARA